MGFPVVSPTILKELTEEMKPMQPNEFCDVIVSPAAVEYAPKLCHEQVVRKLINEKDILSYNMSELPDDTSEQFIEQSRKIVSLYPATAYYWQLRTLIMSILQDRRVKFE